MSSTPTNIQRRLFFLSVTPARIQLSQSNPCASPTVRLGRIDLLGGAYAEGVMSVDVFVTND